YYIFHQFVEGTRLSRPIEAWDAKTPPPKDVLDLVSRAGTDIAPAAGQDDIRQESGALKLSGTNSALVWSKTGGTGIVRALELSIPGDQALAFPLARIRITWDNRPEPSVDAPIALFFGAGILYNRDNRPFLVKSFPSVVRFDDSRVYLS